MTTHTTPIDLREFHGRYVEATIEGITFKGKLSINSKGHVYICHNCFQLKRPNYIEEMFGYDYNYCAQLSGEEVCADSITYITILGESKPINPEWDWKDGEEVYLRGNKYKCHMLKDDLVCFASAATGVCRKLFTLKAAYNHGFRKLPPQPQRKLVEITEDMFDKTNLINHRVEFINEDYTVNGMRLASGKRLLSLIGIQAEININECKLIEQ